MIFHLYSCLYVYVFVLFNTIHHVNSFGIIKSFLKKIQGHINIHRSKIKQINGFYGLAGPDVNISKINSLYELFTGDGIVHGVFLENGKITQTSHKVQTEKIKYESKHGKFVNHILLYPLYMLLNKIGLLPNTMGLANTSIIKVLARIFVLFERDLPYELSLNFENKSLDTIQKIDIKDLENFSAHSKFNDTSGKIYSLEYNVILNTVSCLMLNTEMKLMQKIIVSPKYIPVVHDLWFLDKSNSTLFTDSPLEFSFKYTFYSKIPVVFNNKKPTYIRVINHADNSQMVYHSKKAFYIFHYADVIENDNDIFIYAPIYCDIGFDRLNINGKYRLLILDKKTREILMYENPDLEKYNLDFPIKWGDKIILRNIKHNKINGFVICKGISIVRSIFLRDRYIYGEHMLYQNKGFSRIMCFGYDDMDRCYLFLVNPENGDVFDFPLKTQMNIGFHSIFIPR